MGPIKGKHAGSTVCSNNTTVIKGKEEQRCLFLPNTLSNEENEISKRNSTIVMEKGDEIPRYVVLPDTTSDVKREICSSNCTTVIGKWEEETRYVVPPDTTSNEENEYATLEDVMTVKRYRAPYRSQAISTTSKNSW